MTPKIRFEGFSEEWEQRKLGELVQFSKGTGYSKGDLKESGTPIILYGRLYTKYETVITDVDTFVDAKAGSVYSYGGEVIVPASGETAEEISIAAVVENSGVLLGGDLNIITPQADLDPAFLAIRISNGKPHEDMAKMAQGKSVVHLHNTDLEKINLVYPSHEEQTQISSFFRDIDNLISVQQRKYDSLEKVKQYFLQNMFPQDDETTPQIRFEGFSGEWRRGSLKEVFEQVSNYVSPDSSTELWSLTVEEGLTQKTERYNREFLVKKEENFKEVRPGDIVYNPMNMTLGAVGYNCMEKSVAVSGYYTTMTVKQYNDADFFYTWLKSPQAILLYKTYATGTLIEKQRVQFSTLSIIPMAIPNYEEQKTIGLFFSSIERKIKLQQLKLSALKSLKKFFLQNMFPGKEV